MAELIIIRGLPGSGKTTMAKSMEGFAHFEADQWMLDEQGNYHFDSDKLQAAHEACRVATKRALEAGKDVAVSNTFVERWEMQPYLDMGFPVRVLEAPGNYPGNHAVPPEILQQMRELWEPYQNPPWPAATPPAEGKLSIPSSEGCRNGGVGEVISGD